MLQQSQIRLCKSLNFCKLTSYFRQRKPKAIVRTICCFKNYVHNLQFSSSITSSKLYLITHSSLKNFLDSSMTCIINSGGSKIVALIQSTFCLLITSFSTVLISSSKSKRNRSNSLILPSAIQYLLLIHNSIYHT